MSGEFTSCLMAVPNSFCDQLRAKLMVALLEEPAHRLTNMIEDDQDYVVRVCIALGVQMKALLCGEWCITVTIEGLSKAKDFRLYKAIPMRNVNDKPDCCDFKIRKSDFELLSRHHYATAFHFVVTVIARDASHIHQPMPIVGFCKIGPIII